MLLESQRPAGLGLRAGLRLVELPSRCPRDLRESILATSVPMQAILCSGSSEGGAGERLPLQTALGGDAAQGDHAASASNNASVRVQS